MFGLGSASKTRTIDGAEARRLVGAGATLLDVRSPEEFGAGHLQGAINVPVQVLAGRMGELSKGRKVVVYCRSGARSASAAGLLERAGYDVYDLGPMHAW